MSKQRKKAQRQAIDIKGSPKTEPVFPVPAGATDADVATALKVLTDAGLDAEVVPVIESTSAAEFREKVGRSQPAPRPPWPPGSAASGSSGRRRT